VEPLGSEWFSVVGSVEDELNQKLYYFVRSSQELNDGGYDNFIVEYDIVSKTQSYLFGQPGSPVGTGLNLQGMIKSIRIYQGTYGPVIYWTDGITEPKKININAAKNSVLFRGNYANIEMYGGYNLVNKGDVFYYPPAGFLLVDAIQYYVAKSDGLSIPPINYNDGSINNGWEIMTPGYLYAINSIALFNPDQVDTPIETRESMFTQKFNSPVSPPVARFTTNPSIKINRLNQSVYQFRYRYIGFDGEYSDWSMCSNTPIPQKNQQLYGRNEIALNEDNEIVVEIPRPTLIDDFSGTIKEVEVAVRNGGSILEMGDWKLIESFDVKNDHITDSIKYFTLNYDGNKTGLPLNQSLLDQNNSLVPITCQTQEIIGGNIMAYGNCKIGHNIDDSILSQNPPIITQVNSEIQDTQSNHLETGESGVLDTNLATESSSDTFDLTVQNQTIHQA
jgi:hypothetical protein